MKRVLVDTSVWSLALRKMDTTASEQRIIAQLSKLILDLDLVIIGPIRQEILSGISDPKKFLTLRERLSIFEDSPIILSIIAYLPAKLLFVLAVTYLLAVPVMDLYANLRRSGPNVR